MLIPLRVNDFLLFEPINFFPAQMNEAANRASEVAIVVKGSF